MRRIQMILAGVFLGGVILGGVGTGIALVEYSSLSYGGEHLIGEENLVTRYFDFEFEPGENMVTLGDDFYLNRNQASEIQVDNTVPFGVVRYEVTYNEKLVTPYLRFDENEELETLQPEEEGRADGEESQGTDQDFEEGKPVDLGELRLTASYEGSDLGILMQNKDRFLEELKNKIISDYDVLYITDITVRVNQKTLPSVKRSGNKR